LQCESNLFIRKTDEERLERTMILINVRLLLLSSLIAATAAGGQGKEGKTQTSRRNKEAG
jgi:hypothetical protein